MWNKVRSRNIACQLFADSDIVVLNYMFMLLTTNAELFGHLISGTDFIRGDSKP